MSDPSQMIWSDNPNAPQIPYWQYRSEVAKFNGGVIGVILYGIVVALFFKCMATLLNPDNHMKKSVKWGLAAHTVATFLFITISCGIEGAKSSSDYIDNRGYPDVNNSGPLGHMDYNDASTSSTVGHLSVPLNQWFIDGLLLYRCYVIYSMNYWVLILPGAMCLATVALGIAYIHEIDIALGRSSTFTDLFFSYYFVAFALNVLLTLLIIIRILWHRRNFQNAVGTSAGVSGLYTTVVTMLVESCAPYTVSSMLYLIPMATNSNVALVFGWASGPLQVIAPYLIILRVANRRALTSNSLTSRAVGSIQFVSQGGLSGDNGSFPDGGPTRPVGIDDDVPGERGTGVENTIEEVPS